MGAEQSSTTERNTVTKDDIERALEEQRKLYERRFQEMMKMQSHPTAVKTEVKAAAQQPAFKITRSSTERGEVPPSTSAQPTRVQLPRNLPDRASTSNANVHVKSPLDELTRNPSPYNFCREELQSTITHPYRTGLYPDLNQNSPTPSTSGISAQSNVLNSRVSRPNSRLEKETPKPSAPPLPVSREASRSRIGNDADDEVKCPTCKNTYTLNIFNCQEGHSSCKRCKERGAVCGVCRRIITDRRNITLEAYVSERKVPCLNKKEGCTLIVKLMDMESHVKECPFKDLNCPLNNLAGYCNWKGKLNLLSNHFDNLHPAQRQAEEGKEMCLQNICTEDKYVYLIVKGNFNFLFHVWVSSVHKMIFMATQLIGTQFSAQKWTYEIHLYNKREPRKKYEFTDTCKSSAVHVSDIFKEANCACIPLPYAINFFNEGRVCFKFFISRTFQGRGNNQNKKWGRGGIRHN